MADRPASPVGRPRGWGRLVGWAAGQGRSRGGWSEETDRPTDQGKPGFLRARTCEPVGGWSTCARGTQKGCEGLSRAHTLRTKDPHNLFARFFLKKKCAFHPAQGGGVEEAGAQSAQKPSSPSRLLRGFWWFFAHFMHKKRGFLVVFKNHQTHSPQPGAISTSSASPRSACLQTPTKWGCAFTFPFSPIHIATFCAEHKKYASFSQKNLHTEGWF